MALNLQSSDALLTNPALLAQYWQERGAAEAAAQTANRSRTAGEVVGDLGTQLLQGAVGLGQSAYGVGNVATLGLLDRATGMSKNFNETNKILEGWKSAPTQAAKAQGSAAFDEGIGAGVKEYATNPLLLQDLLVTNVPSLIPAGAGAQFAMRNAVGADAIAKYAARGAAQAGALQAGGAADIDTINAAREAGMSEIQAQLAGLGAGAVTGVMTPAVSRITGAAHLEGLVAAKLLGHENPINLAGQTVVKSALSGAVKEGAEETIQSGAETAIQNAFTGKDITKGVAQSAVLGGMAGGILGGGLGAFMRVRSATPQRAEIAVALADNAQAAGVTASPSALATPTFALTPPTAPVASADAGLQFEGTPGLSFAEQQAQGTLDFGTAQPRSAGDLTFKPAEFEPYRPAGVANPTIPMGGPVRQPLIVTEDGDVGTPQQIAATRDLLNDPLYYSQLAKERQQIGVVDPSPTSTWLPGAPPASGEAGPQGDLFGIQPMNFGQAMQARKVAAAEKAAARQAEATARVNEAVAAVHATIGDATPIQQAIDALIAAKQAGLREKDLLSPEDIVRQTMFTTHPDGTVTSNETQIELTPAQVDAEVKKLSSWKEFMVKQLGVKPNELQGKAWKAFNDAANESGMLPVSPEAAGFLSTYANNIDPSASLSKFALKFHEKFGVQDTAATEQPTAAPAPYGAVPDIQPAPALTAAELTAPAVEVPAAVAPEFKMGRQDKDTHTYTDGKQTVTFHKDMDTDLWQWENKETGDSGAFDSPTRADAKANIATILEERGSAWGTRQQLQGNTDLTEGVTRNKFSQKQFDEELDRAVKVALENDEDETDHGAFLDYVQQAFDATGSTEALREAKDYAIKKAEEMFSKGSAALTPAGLKKLVVDIAAAYNERHTYIAGRASEGGAFIDDARFSRAGTENGAALHEVIPLQHIERLQQMVSFVNANLTGKEVPALLFNTVNDFKLSRPLEFSGDDVKVPADAKGVYLNDGVVALIAENLKDAKDAAMTLMHERTHEGFSGLLGNNVAAVTNRLWANAGMRNRIKDKMATLGLDRATAAEEVLVDMQEKGERLTGDVKSKIKNGITKAFDVLLGSNEIVVHDSDVDALLDDVVRYRTKGVSTPASRMTMADAMSHIDGMLAGVPDKLTMVRFSRALDDLNRIAGDSDAPPAENASSVFGGAAKDSMNFVSGLVSAVKNGSFGKLPRELYRFVGVSQLHATFGSLWTDVAEDGSKTNSYDSFASNYAAHADERNRLLHGVGEVSRALDVLRMKSPEKAKKLNALIQFSTFYQLYPGADEQPTAQGIDPVEREEARVKLDSLWKQVGKDGQDVFNKVQTAYNDAFKTRYEAIKNTLAATKGVDLDTASEAELAKFKKEFGDLIESQIHKIGHAPYSPLKRFGDYMVDIRDANGKQVEFTGHDSEADALKFAADQRARYGSEYKVSTTLRSEFNFNLDGVNQEMVNKIKSGVLAMYPAHDVDPSLPPAKQQEVIDRNSRNAEMRAAAEEVLLDAYLHSIPQHSLMQGANARKYVAGFPLDASRAFNSYMVSFAGNVANIKYGAAISKDLADMSAFVRKQGEGNDNAIQMMNVLNAVRGQYDGSKRVEFSPVAEKLTMASFVYMMTSPSQLVMNGLQTPLVAAPRMAATFGIGRTMKALTDAGRMWFKPNGVMSDPNMAPQVKSVLEELHQTGMDDFTLASTMSGLAAGKDSDVHTIWRTMMKIAAYGMHKSEVFNRQITAHAYATMLTEKNPAISHDDLLRATKDFIDNQSHFNYDPHNAPEIMQGPWRKAIFQFQNYRMNMLALLARDIKTAEFGKLITGKGALDPEAAKLARTTLAYTVGTQLGLTGAVGTVISPVIFAIMDAFRDDDDLLDSRTAFLRGHSQLMSHGLMAALPVLGVDPSRVESGSILPYFGDRQYVPKDKTPRDEFNYYLARAAGPSAGLVERLWEASGAIAGGDYKTAIQKGIPKPLADVYTAAVDFDGVRDSKGVKYYDPSLFDSVKAAIGLKSAGRMEADEKRSAVYRAEAHINALSKRALTKVALGYNLGDEELQREGTEKFMQLAQAHPEMVKVSMLRRTIVGAAKSQYNADAHGVGQAGRLSQEVLEAVGE